MKQYSRLSIFYLFFGLMFFLLLRDYMITQSEIDRITYSEFMSRMEQGRVEEIVIVGDHIQGTLSDPKEGEASRFSTILVEPEIAEQFEAQGVPFRREIEPTFFRTLLSWLIPFFIFLAIWMFIARRLSARGGVGGGFLNVGKSKAKIYVETDMKVRFSDVAGADEAKAELEEMVAFLKDPKSYGRLGGQMPKGVLLVGPPGTGKTLLAKAVAGEAGVPFFSTSGAEFVEMFVGVGAARVRDLFEQAKTKAPCIIFIDELDALGKSRTASPVGGHDEKEQTLNQLLVELDGFDSRSGIVLLAATNRPEILDAALLRAGRFDRQILVDKPDKVGRTEILRLHSKAVKLSEAVDLERIASLTPGFTGADLANLVNEAALIATRKDHSAVNEDDFTLAIERIIAGLEKKNRLMNPFERQVVAYHEMGHAIVACALTGTEPVHKVSIIPRGIGSLGYTIQRPIEDRFLMTSTELMNKMKILLGGRAAEKIVFNHLSTGAADDLAKVTDIARSLVARYGMSEKLGSVAYEEDSRSMLGLEGPQSRHYSEETASAIDREVRKLIDQSLKEATEILERNRNILESSSRLLLEEETLTEEQLKPIFKPLLKNPTTPNRDFYHPPKEIWPGDSSDSPYPVM